jgi:hypothetical protein
MDALLTTIDRAVRSVAPVDALIALAAKRLLPRAEAAACPSIYCGRFCQFNASWGTCEPTLPCWLVDWYSYDSFCSHDCAVDLGCCNC